LAGIFFLHQNKVLFSLIKNIQGLFEEQNDISVHMFLEFKNNPDL
jgi:hypothetical protein